MSPKNLNIEKLINVFIPLVFLVIWSGGALFSKLGLEYASIWSFLFLRSTLALLLLIILYVIKNRDGLSLALLKREQAFRIFFSGLLIQVFYLVFYFLAINTHLSLGVIILVLGMQPIITKLVISNKIYYSDIALLISCFIGLTMATLGYHKIEQINLLGVIFAIFALTSITFGTIIQSEIIINPILTLLFQTIISFVIFGVFTAIEGMFFVFNAYSISALIWMGLVVSVGAFLLLMRMLKYNSAEKISTLFFLLPLVTMLLESFFFNKKLNSLTIVGDILVCSSLFLYQYRSLRLDRQ